MADASEIKAALVTRSSASLRSLLDICRAYGSVAGAYVERLGSTGVGQFNTQAFWPRLREDTLVVMARRADSCRALVTMIEQILGEREESDERHESKACGSCADAG